MSLTGFGLITHNSRSNWIRLRTLVILRWIAVAGQVLAITAAQRLYDLQLDLGLCFLAIGVSVIGNLVAVFIYPENKRLSEGETLLMLLFDMLQLTFLLSLTGGLNNPFALLVLAPVTIGATVLPLRMTILLGAASVGLISLVAVYHIPLRTDQGFILEIPDIFAFGFWVAIVIGVTFIAFYARRVTSEMHSMSEALLATQMALAREQKLTDLGGVVAAAAHELGTPLATIKLVSAELMEELGDNEELYDDAALIRDQANRCRDILQSMGRAGKDDLHLRHAPLETVIREAAEPHLERGKTIEFIVEPMEQTDGPQPLIRRQPEVIHGVRNLIQNAVDFAQSSVRISIRWSQDMVEVQIRDDGRGFSPQVIGRIGDPFVRKRPSWFEQDDRPGYEGMGLGLFIAKTLLERSSAKLDFSNAYDPFLPKSAQEMTGAVVVVQWPRSLIEKSSDVARGALGDNRPFES